MNDGRRLVEREVRVDDPDLSPEANWRLTRELQEAVGSDRAQVRADRLLLPTAVVRVRAAVAGVIVVGLVAGHL